MTKAELDELERVFAHDIEGGPMPAPRRDNRHVRRLIAGGMLVEVEATVGNPPWAVTVKGLGLTIPGHMAYCESCDDGEPP